MKIGTMAGLLLLVLLTSLILHVQAMNEPDPLRQYAVKISDILENETAYDGRMMVIEGKIELECGSGCWFVVNDGTGSIYVDILPSNFVIPQKSGEAAKVYGEVIIANGEPQIIGKMVAIDGDVYQ